MAQTVSQPAVYANGLKVQRSYFSWHVHVFFFYHVCVPSNSSHVMKGTGYFVSLQTSIVVTDECNVVVNGEELTLRRLN